ncbi:hypothetical protein IFM89_032308 [Coptis chinensis]|uniref:NPH3 domain-containing protein n=1 Tax=Coptis chinensis TaxID=261450 RepID=A0A835GZ91_9MAGN|nr:hypothetical protein IFM89_032308 [Coptis chinensis]
MFPFIQDTVDAGLCPNVPTCNSLLSAFLRAHRFPDAYEVLQSMLVLGLQPSLQTYQLLLSRFIDRRIHGDMMFCCKLMTTIGHAAHAFLVSMPAASLYGRTGRSFSKGLQTGDIDMRLSLKVKPKDFEGYGKHTSSIAVDKSVITAAHPAYAKATLRGVAPGALLQLDVGTPKKNDSGTHCCKRYDGCHAAGWLNLMDEYWDGLDNDIMRELVKRMGQQLDEASVNDLLIPAPEVAKLVDGYLAKIARDPNLPLSKFLDLAEMVSGFSRPAHDGLYRAIDMFLKEHPSVSKREEKHLHTDGLREVNSRCLHVYRAK